MLGVAGLFCYPFFITSLAVGFALIGHKKYVMPKKYAILISLSIISVLCILQLILVKNSGINFWQYLGRTYTQKTTAGGILIGILTAPVLYVLNRLGAYIVFVALTLILVALTVDYIHYLSKNENLKKSIKVNNQEKPVATKTSITVKELEQSLKNNRKSVLVNAEEEKPKAKKEEKTKITLDAKEEMETKDVSAKRKLGLIASSKAEEDDNSHYYKEKNSESLTGEVSNKEYILSGARQSDSTKLSKIQANLIDLKNRASMMSYPISNTGTISNNDLKISSYTKPVQTENKKDELPSKILHDDVMITPSQIKFDSKSVMGKSNMQLVSDNEFTGEEAKPKVSIIEQSDFTGADFDTNNSNLAQKERYSLNNVGKSNKFDFDQIEPVFIEEEGPRKYGNSLDVEDFTNNVLASLKQEKLNEVKTDRYVSPNNMFKQEDSKVPTPITPKKHIDYVPPPTDLLTTESVDLTDIGEDVVRKREELEMALDTFGIPAKCIGVVMGPAVTRYELEMPAGVSVKRLLALQEDIAYYLSSNGGIRIEAPIPGKRAVGIEVPNEKIATVGLRDIIISPEFSSSKNLLTVALGKDISGEVKTFSLVKIPHLLVAGTTGSGKSVCINSIILSLIYKFSPDDLKFILIDPKRVEFSMYNHLPHLLMPNVITDSEKALNALSWCVDEMERRFVVFANARVKNLEEYNESEEVLEGKAEKLPYIVFIIDELADLLMTAKKEAEEHICRILQKARAAGIHMILATQRPSVDVVTGKIKANLNARICFALMTSADSKTVLDQGGAEKLLGKGDMLFISSDTSVPKRVQGCFVTTKEIDDIVTFVKENNGDFDFDIKTEQAITNPKKDDVITSVDGDKASGDGFDSLMPQVLKSVIENGHASISMIQRKFLVGFPRAARIIDQMESAGYISPSDGGKTRSVYITLEEYEKLYGEE